MNVNTLISLTVNGFAMGMIYALMAMGIILLIRAVGVMNFAQGDLLMMGAFITCWLTIDLELPLYIMVPFSLICFAVLALVFLQKHQACAGQKNVFCTQGGAKMNPILRLDHVCKRFGGVVAAEDVTFSVMPGTVHGLIGPNGAGKSTLMNLISGIYTADEGAIFLDEKDITQKPSHQRARMGIGRTFQTPRFLQRSNIRDNLLLGTDLHRQQGYLRSFFGRGNASFDAELNELMQFLDFSFD